MITSANHPTYQYLRKIMVIPIAAFLFILLAFKIQNKENKATVLKTQIPITIVIDPGHGGKDAGVSFNGIKEKDISLGIAKKIKALNKDENIHLLFTRLDDTFTSQFEDAAFADTNKADLFIALHLDAAPKTEAELKKGIVVYVSSKKENYKSELLATSLINELQNTYDINSNILKKGIWVLEASKCPAALIEIGYITNPEDFKFISSEENLEKIANDILTAIYKYVSATSQDILEEKKPLNFETPKQTSKKIVTFNANEKKQADTIPNQIKAEDIKEINVQGGRIVIKLKSGDSILAIQNHYMEKERQDELAHIMELKQSLVEKNELKRMIEAKQREAQFQNERLEKIMELKKEEINNRQEEFKKMLEMKQKGISAEKQEEFKKMLDMKQKEASMQEVEFKKILDMKQKVAKMQEEEYEKIMEMKQRKDKMQEEENRKIKELKQREDAKKTKKKQQKN